MGWRQLGVRGLAAAVSLALCAGMVMPTWAAVEFNQEKHMDENGFLREGGEYYLAGDVELERTLRIDNQQVSIDLNGCTLSLAKGAVGSVIRAESGSKLTVTDEGVEDVERGGETGAITGGNTQDNGGGVYVSGSELNIIGGKIFGNKAGNGGGIGADDSVVVVEGCAIVENEAEHSGGGVWSNGSGGSFTMNSGMLCNNTAGGVGGDVCSRGSGRLTLADAKDMFAALAADGRDISGWYRDGSAGWGSEYVRYADVSGTEDYDLKAAHDQYFTLTDSEGGSLAEAEKGAEIDVGCLTPGEREGWTFLGWALDGEPVEGFLTVTGPVTLEARWERDEAEGPEPPAAPVNPGVPAALQVPEIVEVPRVTDIEEEDVPLAGLPLALEPGELLTRGQLMAILHWMDSEPASELPAFLDVPADHDFALAIGWAQSRGIALGVTETEFAPDQAVTRGQLTEFLNRYARYVGSDLVLEAEGDPGEVLTWAMAEEIVNDFFARLYA